MLHRFDGGDSWRLRWNRRLAKLRWTIFAQNIPFICWSRALIGPEYSGAS